MAEALARQAMAKIDTTALALKQMGSRWKYVPYISFLCFVVEMVGLGIWNQSALKVVKDVSGVLTLLEWELSVGLSWGKRGVQALTAFYVLLNLAGLALNCGRYTVAYQADQKGQTHRSWRVSFWLMGDFLFIWLWWILTLFTILLLLGSCTAVGSTFALVKAAQVGANSMSLVQNATALLPPTPAGACSPECLDLSTFDFILKPSMFCFCKLDKIAQADALMTKMLSHMKGVAVGNMMMVLVGTWILMIAATEWGVTRRERTLLRRAAEAAAQGMVAESAGLLAGSANSGGVQMSQQQLSQQMGQQMMMQQAQQQAQQQQQEYQQYLAYQNWLKSQGKGGEPEPQTPV